MMNEICKVLSNEHCGHYLNWSLSSQPEVMPEILCVADHHKWRIAIYKEKGGYEKGYQKVDQGRAYGMIPIEPYIYYNQLEKLEAAKADEWECRGCSQEPDLYAWPVFS